MSENIKQEFLKYKYIVSEKRQNQFNTKTTYVVRITSWFLCLLFLFIGLSLIAICTSFTEQYLKQVGDDAGSGAGSLWNSLVILIVEYLPSFAIVFVNTTCSYIFMRVFQKNNKNWERHTQITMVNITILRKAGVRFATIIFYFMTLWNQISCQTSANPLDDSNDSGASGYNETCDFCDQTPCWETFIGESIYGTMDPYSLNLGISIWASGHLDLSISIWASRHLDLGIWASRSGHLDLGILIWTY